MFLTQRSCTVFIMQHLKHILVKALKYWKILIETISTQYSFCKKKVMRNVFHARSLDYTSKMFCQLDILKIYNIIDFNTFISM